MRAIYLGLFFFIFLSSKRSLAQYSDITIKRNELPEVTIVQLDQYANSTVIHFTFRNIAFERFSGSEKIILVEHNTNKTANLLNSYNLPLNPRQHVFGDGVETLNFSLEFEKINIENGFDILGGADSDFNLYNITIDQNQAVPLLTINDFVSETPSKEYYVFYHEGYPVLRYAYKGIVIAVKLVKDESYGKHFQPNFLIQNYSDKDILFDPELVVGQWKVNDRYYKAPVIAYNSYIKHVKKMQRRQELGIALGEAFAALPAGFASINTTSNAYATAYGMSTGNGYIGYVPIGFNSTASASVSAVSQSKTSIYNGAAGYAASQQAKKM